MRGSVIETETSELKSHIKSKNSIYSDESLFDLVCRLLRLFVFLFKCVFSCCVRLRLLNLDVVLFS